MTDRLKGLVVAFDKDFREDDAESIIEAIKMIKGVSNVSHVVANTDDWINRMRIKNELADKLMNLYQEL